MRLMPVMGLCALMLAPACASVNLADGEGDAETHRYFGFVELKVPSRDGRIHAYAVKSAGIALEDGLMIGWRESEQVIVPIPLEEGEAPPDEAPCSLIVIVRSDAQAKHAREILSGLDGEKICLTSFQ